MRTPPARCKTSLSSVPWWKERESSPILLVPSVNSSASCQRFRTGLLCPSRSSGNVSTTEEPPEEDGKTELVIEFGDIYLELVEPDYIFYIRPGADTVPDIEAPDLPPPDLAYDEDLVDEPVRRKSPEEAARERPFVVHRVDLIGERENSKGVKCEAGYIVLTNAGGGTLSGAATSTHDALEVEPKRFRGNKVQLSYWVNTEELPDNYEVFIQLKTGHEERSISVYEMIGQARG